MIQARQSCGRAQGSAQLFWKKFAQTLVACLIFSVVGHSQVDTATVSGVITDQSGAIVVGAEVLVTNTDTNVMWTGASNDSGIYLVTGLKPGRYRIHVGKEGFKGIDLTDLVLNVQDSVSRNFTLQVGSTSESISVEGNELQINTQDASVSTVVNRTYVENVPLNGRSFQDLILLTPGVVTTSPQMSAALGASGEFSVNGQRTESNYYSVDGVSANIGILAGDVRQASTTGSLPVATALGTTQGLVSVDALEEFRVSSSTYSAEYGRNPGGQFSFVTRSGTNQWHGTTFDYLRNDAFDANDWFNNLRGQHRTPLRQNDFGGTLGGPVKIPGLYEGKDRTFFFFSYEGLRLIEPQASTISAVPDAALRTSAPTALQPVLNAFPAQNGAEILDQNGSPTGLAEFISASSNKGQLDSYSIRFDHVLNQKLKLFFRFADTSSNTFLRAGGSSAVPSNPQTDQLTSRTYTVGLNWQVTPRVVNEFHLNYSSNEDDNSSRLDGFGGAQPADLVRLGGFAAGTTPVPAVQVNLFLDPSFAFVPGIVQQTALGIQRQWNVTDSVSLSLGRHQLKIGADFRRVAPLQAVGSPVVIYEYDSSGSVQANSVDSGEAEAFAAARPTYINFSAFAQDEWRITSNLNLSVGLRWEVNPAPGATDGNIPFTVQGSSPATFTLAPKGTSLWRTTWYNFAPRLGVAYVVRESPGYEIVLRGGGGAFFDTGQQAGSYGFLGPGFSAISFFGSPAGFPQPPSQVTPLVANPPVAPYGNVYAFPPHLQLPFILQWNASLEQSLGKSQTVSVSYVGANGRRLLGLTQTRISSVNPNFTFVNFFANGLTSDYDSLQARYQRRLSRGLQGLGSYTWAHAIDYGSQNTSEPFRRGNSAFDVRHTFSGALSYEFPNAHRNDVMRALMNNWGLDCRFSARTGFPVSLNGRLFVDPATGQLVHSGLNVVQGQPYYLYGSQYPGGWSINPAAFSIPPRGTFGDAPRNFVRGFGAWQMDLAVRREFPIYERLKLQFRAEAFNVLNHPNFGVVSPSYCSGGTGCTFGQATATLAQSLGVLSPLYQAGGPRSMQFALKFVF